MKKKPNVYQMTILSMLIAILIIQTFVPWLGYIPVGPIDATIVHITVILAAILFGSKIGLGVGTSWGLLSMLRAYMQPTAFNVVFLNPLISVVPRMLVGWISGLIFPVISKRISMRWAYSITALVGTLLNTVLVLGGIYLFAGEMYAAAMGVPETALLGILGSIVLTNGIIEIIVSMILMPLVAAPLSRALNRKKK